MNRFRKWFVRSRVAPLVILLLLALAPLLGGGSTSAAAVYHSSAAVHESAIYGAGCTIYPYGPAYNSGGLFTGELEVYCSTNHYREVELCMGVALYPGNSYSWVSCYDPGMYPGTYFYSYVSCGSVSGNLRTWVLWYWVYDSYTGSAASGFWNPVQYYRKPG